MLGAEQAGLNAGRHVLAWVLGQTDIWYLLYRCANYINKGHGQSPSSVSILDNLFTLDEEHQDYSDDERLLNQQDLQRRPETLNNGTLSLSPPHIISQRESLQVMQPASAPGSPPSSPCCSPISGTSTTTTNNNNNSNHLNNNNNNGNSSTASNSPSPGTLDPNWQATKPTVRERNAAMFNNDLMADVRFIVGNPGSIQQTIPAHKYVLATGSSVFYAMFYGGLAECKDEIEVPDVEPCAFLTLLKYLYCDEIQLEADTVLATLYVAKKYIVPHLARACVNYLETSLTAKNACLLLSQSRLFEEPELMQRCWEVIDAQVCLTHSLSCLDLTDVITKRYKQNQQQHEQHQQQRRHMSFSAYIQSKIP